MKILHKSFGVYANQSLTHSLTKIIMLTRLKWQHCCTISNSPVWNRSTMFFKQMWTLLSNKIVLSQLWIYRTAKYLYLVNNSTLWTTNINIYSLKSHCCEVKHCKILTFCATFFPPICPFFLIQESWYKTCYSVSILYFKWKWISFHDLYEFLDDICPFFF